MIAKILLGNFLPFYRKGKFSLSVGGMLVFQVPLTLEGNMSKERRLLKRNSIRACVYERN